jgi:hypothetical protein
LLEKEAINMLQRQLSEFEKVLINTALKSDGWSETTTHDSIGSPPSDRQIEEGYCCTILRLSVENGLKEWKKDGTHPTPEGIEAFARHFTTPFVYQASRLGAGTPCWHPAAIIR